MNTDEKIEVEQDPEIKSFIRENVIDSAKRIKGDFPPISEKIKGIHQKLKIKSVHVMKKDKEDIFFFTTKNYSKYPKSRYFFGISLASQSSDFLVILATDFAKEHDLKLMQYTIYPKQHRIYLISLKEFTQIGQYEQILDLLKKFRAEFRVKLKNLKNKL